MERNRNSLRKLGLFQSGAFGAKEGVPSRLVDVAHSAPKKANSQSPSKPRAYPPIYKKLRPQKLERVAPQSQCFTANDLEMPEITNVLYINLDESTERKAHMEKMLTDMGLPHQRIAAIRPTNSMGSHLKLGEVGVWLGHQKVPHLEGNAVAHHFA